MAKRKRIPKIVKLVQEWGLEIGRSAALARLMARDISESTATKMLNGNYRCMPGKIIRGLLEDELGQDGYKLV
ncbi:MAG: hypothetical protein R3213_04195 [Flavobacteriaceae bacterium]|nr:hypothetical protein [Flavobacteriaceae bacterium]